MAKYANTSEDDMDIEMQEPYHLLRGLNIVDLEDLMEDINVYLEMEKDVHYNYWKVCYRVMWLSCDCSEMFIKDMMIICEDELQKLKKMEQLSAG